MSASSTKSNDEISDCYEDDLGISLREVESANEEVPAVNNHTQDLEEEESFLHQGRHHPKQQSTTAMWTPCQLIVCIMTVFVSMTIATYSVLHLDQLQQPSTPILRFHTQIPPASSRLWQNQVSSSPSMASNWTFRIMQITDIHLGEDEYTDWGPEQDFKTFQLLDKMFAFEQPHLVVMGGDQLTANNCQHNCTEYYRILGRYLTLQGIPWATVLGNHDDMAFEPHHDKNQKTTPHEYARRELLAVDESFSLSLTQTGPKDVTGASNYVLDVMGPASDNNKKEAVLQIFFLDSGGGTLPETVDNSQIQWFIHTASLRKNLPAVAFQHIPTYGHLFDADTCTGYEGQHVEQLYYTQLVNAMVESGRFHFLGVGHTHGNDYCCPYQKHIDDGADKHDLYFCFGRHSGYGGYGNWQRGVRMYELMLSPMKFDDSDREDHSLPEPRRKFKWRSWVRLESGAYVDFLDYDHTRNH
jgi:hypothetical protein